MSEQLPRNQTGVLLADEDGVVSFGTAVAIAFDGNHSFSFAGWFRMRYEEETGTLVGKQGEFTFGVQDGVPYARLAGQFVPVTASQPLDTEWHFLAVSFASNGSRGGLFTLFQDGAQVGQVSVNNVGTSDQGQPLVAGGELGMALWSLSVYSVAITASQCVPAWSVPTSGAGLVASYAFAQVPASDASGNSNPITYGTDATQQIACSCVTLEETAYCLPSDTEGVNPGGKGNDPFTIQAWVYPGAYDDTQCIFSNGPVDGSCVSLYLAVDPATGNPVPCAQHGTDTLSSGQVLEPHAWYNLAVTYDGTGLILYVNGEPLAKGTSGAMTQTAQSAPVIGAGFQAVSYPPATAFLQGSVQSVDVWSTALTAADVGTYMYAEPWLQTSCVASYALHGDPVNLMTGSTVALLNGAVVDEVYLPPVANTETLYAEALARRPAPRPRGPVLPSEAVAAPVQPLKQEELDRMVRTLDLALPRWVGGDERARVRETFSSGLAQANADLQSGTPLNGTVTHRREGDEWVFHHHTAAGAEEVLRLSARDVDSCTAWTISLVSTIVVGMLGILSVPLTSSRVTARVARAMGNSRLAQAVAQVIGEEVTVRSVLVVLTKLFTAGELTAIIGDALADLSWWDYAFAVTAVMFQLIELMFPNPSSPAFYLLVAAKMGVLLVQLGQVILQKPAGCNGG